MDGENNTEQKTQSEEHGHWCKFCQQYHSSATCYHPARRVIPILQFYANAGNYIAYWDNDRQLIDTAPILRDAGNKAKSFLEEINDAEFTGPTEERPETLGD